MNSDACIFYDGTVGLGFFVRDEKGKPVLAGAKRCSVDSGNSLLMEVELFESDSKNLVHAIEGISTPDASSALIVDDIAGVWEATGVRDITFTHFLAHFSPSVNFDFIWDGGVLLIVYVSLKTM
ncbi:hypothetical protein ACS0TY_006354 [Phlomoides rotata]